MTVPTPPLTLGVEEEYQIIEPDSRNLYSYISEFLSQDEKRASRLHLKPEFMQSQVEVGSHVCRNIREVRQEVVRLRRAVTDMAEKNGLYIAAASTHPFARWDEQSISEGERYRELLEAVTLPGLEFWVVCHQDLRFSARVRALMGFLGEWFGGTGEVAYTP